MNRQAANYVESVGDPMPRIWQTKKHNIIGLCIVSALFILFSLFFWFFNHTSLDIADISLTEQNPNNCVLASNIYLTYSQSGDFDFSENGEVTYYPSENRWKRLWSPAKCAVFAENYYDQKRIIAEDTLTILNVSDYERPSFANSDKNRAISDKKEYIIYSDLLFSTKFKSSLVSPINFYEIEREKSLYADFYRYEDQVSMIAHRDTILAERNMHLYAKVIMDTVITGKELIDNKLISTEQTKEGTQYIYKADYKCLMYLIPKEYVFGNKQRNSSTLFLFGIQRYLRLANRTCCNLYIRSVQFPCDSDCRFILSFSSPMYFDKLSIEPDEENPNEIIYSSPEKIKLLKASGLYVYARDVSSNKQDMLNFFFATMLGILISYFIEFCKRLYNARMDKLYNPK